MLTQRKQKVYQLGCFQHAIQRKKTLSARNERQNKQKVTSRPISRVLYGHKPKLVAWQPFIWDACCQTPRATYPDNSCGAMVGKPTRCPYSVLLPVGFTVPCLLPAMRWALTPPFHPYSHKMRERSAFCGTFPRVAPAGRYPAPFLRGARTFLGAHLSASQRRGCPADWSASA